MPSDQAGAAVHRELSKLHVTWSIPHDASPGVYRFVHNGICKQKNDGSIHEVTGQTDPFRVE
jgi:hypothetical protein